MVQKDTLWWYRHTKARDGVANDAATRHCSGVGKGASRINLGVQMSTAELVGLRLLVVEFTTHGARWILRVY